MSFALLPGAGQASADALTDGEEYFAEIEKLLAPLKARAEKLINELGSQTDAVYKKTATRLKAKATRAANKAARK